jgi:hypothetical protein
MRLALPMAGLAPGVSAVSRNLRWGVAFLKRVIPPSLGGKPLDYGRALPLSCGQPAGPPMKRDRLQHQGSRCHGGSADCHTAPAAGCGRKSGSRLPQSTVSPLVVRLTSWAERNLLLAAALLTAVWVMGRR